MLWYAVLYVRLLFVFSRSQYTASLLCQLFLRPQRVHNNTTKYLIPHREHDSPGVTQSLRPSALYSRPSSNAGLGEVIVACCVKPRCAHFVWVKQVYTTTDPCGLLCHFKRIHFLDMKNVHIVLVADVANIRGGVRITVSVYLNFSSFGKYFTRVFIYFQMHVVRTAPGRPRWEKD